MTARQPTIGRQPSATLGDAKEAAALRRGVPGRQAQLVPSTSLRSCFNEAAALRRGVPRCTSGKAGGRLGASMRPRHYAAEYAVDGARQSGNVAPASMRPRNYAAEYGKQRPRFGVTHGRFNEAAALRRGATHDGGQDRHAYAASVTAPLRRGVRQIRGLQCQGQIACFNEAAALRRGVRRRCDIWSAARLQ